MRWIAGILSLVLCAGVAQSAGASIVYSTAGVIMGGNPEIDVQVFPQYTLDQIRYPDAAPFNEGGMQGPYGVFGTPPVTLLYVFETAATLTSSSNIYVEDNVTYWSNQWSTYFGQILDDGGVDCARLCGDYITPKITSHTIAFLDPAHAYNSWSSDGAGDYYFYGQRPNGATIFLQVDPSDIGQAYSLTVYSVPEPATWAYLVAGVGLVGSRLRRRRAYISPLSC